MIAFVNEAQDQITREDGYALRRILVGRLQQRSRGVTRGDRVTQLRRFSDEWTSFVECGKLPLLRRVLAVGPAAAVEAGDLWRHSYLLTLACQVDQVGGQEEAPPAPPARTEPAATASAPSRRGGDRERKGQVDLFPVDMAAMPA